MNTLYAVIGEPFVVDNDQATFTVDPSILVTMEVGTTGIVAQSRLRVLENDEYPYSFLDSILNS